MQLRLIQFITFIALSVPLLAAQDTDSVPSDTTKHVGLIQRIINYFGDANKPKRHKRFDFSVIGGPHYSSDSKFGLGVVLAGEYDTAFPDTLTDTQLSNVGLYADATTAGHFSLSFRGNHFTPFNKFRATYDVTFESIDTKFWGIGYAQCSQDINETDYRYLAARANINFSRNMGSNIYFGPVLVFDYINARHTDPSALWDGLPKHTLNWGLGLALEYDTRDCITSCHKGLFFKMSQYFDPSWLGNKYAFAVNEFTGAVYNPLWKGACLASQLHWRLTWGDTPWGAMSTLGGSHNMRGYFEGRYRDKSEVDICVELRQNVWRRNGVVLWGGAASIFAKPSQIQLKRILPNWGIGYRWEFKKNMNIRLDLGFGRGQCGFIFNINEAF